jgi:Txe/YoeB family toxin of Txe-Axe toxin-antitoxin module
MGDPAADEVTNAILADEMLVGVFLKIREAKARVVKEFEEMVKAKYEDPLKQISTELKRRLLERGSTGIKTESGTVYQVEDMKATCADWGLFHTWIVENNALDMMERRIKSTAIKEYMENNAGTLPPGVNVFRETEIRVRRGK